MSRLESAGRAVWDFVVGDDWRVAAGVVIALAVTALVAGTTVAAWWILPLATLLMLGTSVWLASRPPR
jgi:hypothetical protein